MDVSDRCSLYIGVSGDLTREDVHAIVCMAGTIKVKSPISILLKHHGLGPPRLIEQSDVEAYLLR